MYQLLLLFESTLANLSVTPAVGYKASNIYFENEAYNETDHNINLDVITRAAVVYNNTKYYIGASLLAHTYDYHRKRFWINNTYGILQFYVGLKRSLLVLMYLGSKNNWRPWFSYSEKMSGLLQR